MLVVSLILIATGFNTVDSMMWGLHYQAEWWLIVPYWDMGPFNFPKWWAYALFGVLPLMFGCTLLGWILHDT